MSGDGSRASNIGLNSTVVQPADDYERLCARIDALAKGTNFVFSSPIEKLEDND